MRRLDARHQTVTNDAMAKLVFLGKDFNGHTYQLQLERTTVGRSSDNTLVVPHSSVSHHHCEILTYGNEVIVRDLGSTNGTFVDDARLKPQSGVRDGQVIRFGDVQARLELDSATEPSSDVTAVHDFARAVRDQRREKARAGHDPKEVLQRTGPIAAETPQTQTFIKQPPAPRPQPSAPAPQPAPPPPPARGKRSILWLIVLAVVVAGLVYWWLTRKS
jgi:pSer/pThr/pTyr-binding forkhead associated (FHA) protein